MLFNSLTYAWFFSAVLVAFYACPIRYRWLVLLGASYAFYAAWKPAYLALIVVSTLCDYAVALAIARRRQATRRYLAVSLAVNLGLLGVFKYAGFINDSARVAAEYAGLAYPFDAFSLIIPVGISFYTFQTLSYTVDVHREGQPAVRHLGKFALFVAFFPQLVAGPIERGKHLIPQLDKLATRFEYDRIRAGLQIIAWGLFKKVVIADNLAPHVDATYAALDGASGVSVFVATLAFAVQIYCDFSGYCDIAVGSAQCFGVELSANFRSPYFAANLRNFWARWHITLSRWFRDYVYIPMGGNRASTGRTQLNLLVTFLLSGLWHGAAWTFVYWGGIHGIFLLIQRALPDLPRSENGALRVVVRVATTLCTFSIVCLAWIFFRAADLDSAFAGLASLVSIDVADAHSRHWALAGWSAAALFLTHLVQDLRRLLSRLPKPGRWLIYYALAIAIIRYGSIENTPFVYFQF